MHLQRFLDFFESDGKDPIMTQNDPEKDKKSKISRFLTFLCNFCQSFDKHREIECSKHLTRQDFVNQ